VVTEAKRKARVLRGRPPWFPGLVGRARGVVVFVLAGHGVEKDHQLFRRSP